MLMQKQGTTEVGHLGCVIQDTLERSRAEGRKGRKLCLKYCLRSQPTRWALA